VGALFAPERRIDVRLVELGPASISDEARRLARALGRTEGRAAFTPPPVHGVSPPAAYAAFVEASDWADPSDPEDLYRELAIGRIEGTLRFLRVSDLSALDRDPSWAGPASAGLFPIASLRPAAPGAPASARRVLALAPSHDRLVLVSAGGQAREAGPTFGELLLYLALGWKRRSDWEEEVIAALMLRAKVRAGGSEG